MDENEPTPDNDEGSSVPDAAKVVGELKDLKKEVAEIRTDLNSANDVKEQAYSKKEVTGKNIGEMITKIKDMKIRRDQLTKEVQELKSQRQKLNGDLGEKIAKIKVLYEQRDKLGLKAPVVSDKPRIPAAKIKKEIEALEYKIETEVMPFDKEQKMMKLIKDKKKELGQSNTGSEIFDQISHLSRDIKVAKKTANDVHKQIQLKAAESQKLHEEMIGISKGIDDLKGTEKEAHSAFLEAKKKFLEVNSKLKERSGSIKHAHDRLDAISEENKKEKRKKIEKVLEEKRLAVDEKIKKKMKLTTEDLLSYQKMKHDDN